LTERGRIRDIKGKTVTVAPDRSAACFGCVNTECKRGGGFITAGNPFALLLEPGQTVEVKSPPGISLLAEALTAFLPPTLGFTAGFVLSRLLFPKTGEGAAAFTGLAFLFGAAFAVYRLKRKKPARGEYTVTRIIG
jgi:sigma-E factor negative regulatory protein RseC